MARIALAVAAIVADVAAGMACSCIPDERPAEVALGDYAVVFAGAVDRVEAANRDGDERLLHAGDIEVRFRVERAWKGVSTDRTTVVTPATGPACGYHFEPGRTYLVWANRDRSGRLKVTLCSRTRSLDGADDEIRRLGTPERAF